MEEELTRNDLVLDRILIFLPISSLKVARTVSRRWNQMASSLFLDRCSKVVVCFPNTSKEETPVEQDLEDFTALVKSRGDTPFTSFDLESSFLKNEETVEEFFRVTGPYMKTLALRVDDDDGFVVECPSLSRLESLRSFKIIVGDTDDDAGLNHFLALGKRVISASRDTLEDLAVIVQSYSDDNDDAVMACIIPPLLLQCKLSRLELDVTLRGSHLRALAELKDLKLTHLSLESSNSRFEDPGPMKEFLTSQSSTLESLTLTAYKFFSEWVVEFPCMSNLKVIEVSTNIILPLAFVFPNFSFVDQFPKLRTLLVAGSQAGIEQILREDIQPSLSVEEVSLKRWFGVGLEDQGPRLAGTCFPNLKRCEVTWDLLTKVYEFLPNLEELTVLAYSPTLIDLSITGVSYEDTAAMNKRGSYENEIHQIPRNITCLKKLKKLNLASHRHSIPAYFPAVLTEASFRLALFRMEGLKSLDLGFAPLDVSWDCVEEMRKRFSVRGLNWTPRPN